MTKPTHTAIGTLAALAVTQPHTPKDLMITLGAAAIGSVISDVDVTTSKSHRDLQHILAVTVAAVVAIVAAQLIFHRNFVPPTAAAITVELLAGALFLAISAFGMQQPHRSFMHSFLAVVLLSTCTYFILPALVIPFAAAMLSHMAIDLLNFKGEKLFYPHDKGYCFYLCMSNGTVNELMGKLGTAVSVGLVIYFIIKMLPIHLI